MNNTQHSVTRNKEQPNIEEIHVIKEQFSNSKQRININYNDRREKLFKINKLSK